MPADFTEEVEDIALLLKTLGEPARLTILEIISAANGDAVCACVFPNALGISQPTASHHLRKLTDAGLLTREQRGKWAYFRLVPDGYQRVRAFLDPLLSRQPAGSVSG
jgi:ArsR family transcriptional regulator